MKVAALYISPGHNFFGHHGKPPSAHETVPVQQMQCVAGSGVRGDRFFNYKRDYAGQITFFAEEVHQALLSDGPFAAPWSPAAYRRNVLTRGVDLNSLIGKEFTLQGIRFSGAVECKPCYWMDRAARPGAEAFLKGNGGLRARILSDGELSIDCATAAGLLLGGGRSLRMGQDKGSLIWEGRTLRDHQAATLAKSGAWPLYYACRAEQRETPSGFNRIEDRTSNGALGAFADAFQQIREDVVTVLTVDTPRIHVGLLTKLAARAREERVSIVPQIEGRFEPFVAAWHRSAAVELCHAASAGRSLQESCARLQAAGALCAVTSDEAQQFANLNTPEDWENLQRRG